MVYLMVIIYYLIQKWSFHRDGWINSIVFTILPYVIITFINNTIMTNFGYFEVSSDVIIIIILAVIPLYIGITLAKFIVRNNNRYIPQRQSVIITTNMNCIFFWCLSCCFVRIIQLLIIYQTSGIASIAGHDFIEFGLGGLPSHLFLTTIPFSAIILNYGMENNKSSFMLLWILEVIVAALSFIKYHAIIIVIYTAIYCIIKKEENVKRWLLYFGGLIVIVFVGNYVVGFMILGITRYTFFDYMIKFWDYVGGSLINCNYSISEYGEVAYSWIDLVYSSITPLPNAILSRYLEIPLDHTWLPLGFRVINKYGSTSNVMSLYFINLYTGSCGYFLFYLFFHGFITESIISKIHNGTSDSRIPFFAFFLSVNALSFFSNYYELSAIWEILILSYLLPRAVLKEKIIL